MDKTLSCPIPHAGCQEVCQKPKDLDYRFIVLIEQGKGLINDMKNEEHLPSLCKRVEKWIDQFHDLIDQIDSVPYRSNLEHIIASNKKILTIAKYFLTIDITVLALSYGLASGEWQLYMMIIAAALFGLVGFYSLSVRRNLNKALSLSSSENVITEVEARSLGELESIFAIIKGHKKEGCADCS